jgi:hypothetical protein
MNLTVVGATEDAILLLLIQLIILSLSPWSRVLTEKLTVAEPVKKFSALIRVRRFITVFTRTCRWSGLLPCLQELAAGQVYYRIHKTFLLVRFITVFTRTCPWSGLLPCSQELAASQIYYRVHKNLPLVRLITVFTTCHSSLSDGPDE